MEIGDGPADVDFADLVVMPGLVDSHVHVNEPGRTEWEGFATATRAAAAGGTTTIVDMPLNSIPPTIDASSLAAKRGSAHGKLAVDVAFWGGLVPGSQPHVEALIDAGVCGFKSFLVDSGVPEFLPMSLADLSSVLPTLAKRGVPSLVHAEDGSDLRPLPSGTRSYQAYLDSRPASSEARAVRRVSEIASSTGAAVHVLHVSSGEAVDVIGSGPPQLGGETCPHYLTFSAEDIPEGATQFKCAPPIRDAEHREALWEGLRRGSLGMVVSDHSPSPAELKDLEGGDFSVAWGGIASLQVRLHATWTGASPRGAGVAAMAEWLSEAPARLAGLDDRKGALAVGRDADFLVFDPDGVFEVRGQDLLHRHPITPYHGMCLMGRVRATYLRGVEVFDGAQVAAGHGRMLQRG